MEYKPFQIALDLIRYDSRIIPMARIYYAELKSRCISRKGCFKNISLFADLFGVSSRQIENWHNQLISYGYIYDEINKESGLTYTFPKTTAEQDVENFKAQNKKPIKLNIEYTTSDGRVLRNANEAKMYFHAIVDSKTNLPDSVKSKLNMFLNVFATCIFDEEYFNKKYSNNFVATKEFFEFALQNMTIDEIYPMMSYIFNEDIYIKIRRPDYYILTCICDMFKREYTSKAKHIYMKEKRKGMKKLWLRKKK